MPEEKLVGASKPVNAVLYEVLLPPGCSLSKAHCESSRDRGANATLLMIFGYPILITMDD